MTVQLATDGTIVLDGACSIEDAERLHGLLLQNPAARVDWRACEHAHTAIVQILLVARPAIDGPPKSPFLERWIAPMLAAADGG